MISVKKLSIYIPTTKSLCVLIYKKSCTAIGHLSISIHWKFDTTIMVKKVKKNKIRSKHLDYTWNRKSTISEFKKLLAVLNG